MNVLNELTVKQNGVLTTYKIGTIEGYYNSTDGKFYIDSSYTTELEGASGLLYVDLTEKKTYIYDTTETEFVVVGGGGGATDVIRYVETLPVGSNIENIIYGNYSTADYNETVAEDFLDENNNFTKESDTYTPASGLDIQASADNITYKDLVSLALVSGDYIATYSDSNTDTFSNGDIFYYKVGSMKYYAGDATNQEVNLLAGSGGGGGGGATYIPGEGINITSDVISVTPATNATLGGVKPDNSTIVTDANGTISGNYQGGHGINIDGNEISDKTFIGTAAEWAALTPAQQAEYDMVSISDDGAPVDLTPGHTIQDETTTFPQRSNLQFEDMTITDDSTNGITKVAPIPYTAGDKIDITNNEVSCDETVKGTFIGTKTEWEALSTTDKAKYDIVNLTDDAASPSVVVDTVADGNMNAVTSNAVYEALQNIGPGKTLVPWIQASDSEVAAMINAYYNDELTLAEIQTVWHVGDIRTITLGSIGAIGVGESHRSQNVDVVILDFEHDNLTTAINGHTKALITVQLKDCLRDATVADDGGQNNTEHGYMNDTNTNVGGWTSSKRRAWCNNYFYNAIPASMRTLIKPVNKLTSAGNSSSTINTDSDKCFLVSEIEIFGSAKWSKTGEGNLYNYFETASNRYKLPRYNSSSLSAPWWERSPYSSNASEFCFVRGPGGDSTFNSASFTFGLAPAWCL